MDPVDMAHDGINSDGILEYLLKIRNYKLFDYVKEHMSEYEKIFESVAPY